LKNQAHVSKDDFVAIVEIARAIDAFAMDDRPVSAAEVLNLRAGRGDDDARVVTGNFIGSNAYRRISRSADDVFSRREDEVLQTIEDVIRVRAGFRNRRHTLVSPPG